MSKFDDSDYEVMKMLWLEHFQKIEKENEILRKELNKYKEALRNIVIGCSICQSIVISKDVIRRVECEYHIGLVGVCKKCFESDRWINRVKCSKCSQKVEFVKTL